MSEKTDLRSFSYPVSGVEAVETAKGSWEIRCRGMLRRVEGSESDVVRAASVLAREPSSGLPDLSPDQLGAIENAIIEAEGKRG